MGDVISIWDKRNRMYAIMDCTHVEGGATRYKLRCIELDENDDDVYEKLASCQEFENYKECLTAAIDWAGNDAFIWDLTAENGAFIQDPTTGNIYGDVN